VVGEENHYTIKAFEFRKPEAKNATGNATGAGGLSVRCIGINAELEARNLVMATTDDPVQYAENLAKSNLLALEADSIGCPIAVHTTPNQPPQADDSILEELWPF
ncbi:MAG: hypothetical protein ACPGWS_09660, partial [Solirubrobacterales bacterium]